MAVSPRRAHSSRARRLARQPRSGECDRNRLSRWRRARGAPDGAAGRGPARGLHHRLAGLGGRFLHGEVDRRGLAALGGLQHRGLARPGACAREASRLVARRLSGRQRDPGLGPATAAGVAAGARGAGGGIRPRPRGDERGPRRMEHAPGVDRLPPDRPALPARPGAARHLSQRRAGDAEQPDAASETRRGAASPLRSGAQAGGRAASGDRRRRGAVHVARCAEGATGLRADVRGPAQPSGRGPSRRVALRDPGVPVPLPGRARRASPDRAEHDRRFLPA